jgi:hypothetical protein
VISGCQSREMSAVCRRRQAAVRAIAKGRKILTKARVFVYALMAS